MALVEAVRTRYAVSSRSRGQVSARRKRGRVSSGRSAPVVHLSAAELEALFIRFAQTGDESIREQLIRSHIKLAEKVARNFRTSGEPLEDIIQEAYIGLVKAVDSFDPSLGVKFSTYASHKISGQIRHYLRDRISVIRQPGWLHERSRRVARCHETLRQKLNREPTLAELAAEVGISEDELLEVNRTRGLFRVTSLDAPENPDEETTDIDLDRKKIQSLRTTAQPLPVEERVTLSEAIKKLKRLERAVIYALYYRGLSQTEIAEQLNISCNYVSHILRNALQRLRQILASEEVKEAHLRAKAAGQPAQLIQVKETIDPLTKLPNHRVLRERLEEEILRASRIGYEITVMALDVDDLGTINETFGFVQGDRLLAEIGNLLRNTLRKVDVGSRFGGGTFILMLPHTGEKGKRTVAQRILREIASLEIRTRLGRIKPTCGAGLAVYPLDGDSRDELIDVALENLRKAKAIGANVIRAARDK
ncbi:MAG: sigma-70 family RNA polymerase sigma factor [Candidatus Zipacnadales bacterium]